ncbi:coiled-coil domain-containing protein 97 isoform X2 [Folsomia candida]|uniref:Coiled-coil domain-containing protein 97 n=1 Tax=Folsomia candida TaxID=158441 RepID=A0A226EKK5_FOLCA|nr:coiled-coil domain-containing protein 97 isoform X2 [Folsomia candida]OXA57524.1 Coiled-coil domain-containing protein 97 [Folsomia candida]
MEVDNSTDLTTKLASSQSTKKELTSSQLEMLEMLSKIPELRVKNQQKTETDLTNEEKFDALREKFVLSPLTFLTSFGKHFTQSNQFQCLRDIQDEGVETYLKLLDRNLSGAKLRLKNRRYAALQKLVDTTDYFTEEEMQRRNPILFDQLIGKFQSKEEKEAFASRSYNTAACSKTPLTDLLMAHMNRNEQGESYRRLDQEQQTAEEEEADNEYFDDDEEMDQGNSPSRRSQGKIVDEDDCEEIEDEEKEILKEEFFTTMYQHFLDGKDIDFDYASVDNNDEYDIGENLELDEQEKYFDGEEPCDINSIDSSSCEDVMYKPPVRCSDIEFKIQTLTVKSDCNSPSYTKVRDNLQMNQNNEDDEDELDAYMKTIEKQLQSQ